MSNVLWKDVVNYKDLYKISNNGDVCSVDRYINKSNGIKECPHFFKGRLLKQYTNKDGYKRVCLRNKNAKWKFVHRLVAEAFIPNPDNLPEVNHKDENKDNNCVDNLEWCEKLYNMNYGERNKKIKENNANTTSILQFDLEGNFMQEYSRISDACDKYHIRSSGISNCCRGLYKQSGGYIWKYKEEGLK